MRKVLLCTLFIFGLLLTNNAYSKSKSYNGSSITGTLPGITKVEVKQIANKKYTMAFINMLDKKEIVYKKNKIVFTIDNKVYEYTFKLYIKLSNAGVEEKATVVLSKEFLIKIVESKLALVKIGDKRRTEVDNTFRDKLITILK